MIDLLFECFTEIILMIAVGYAAAKSGIMTEQFTKKLSDLLILVMLPCAVMSSSSGSFDPSQGKDIIVSMILSFFYFLTGIVVSYLIFRKLPIEAEKRSVSVTSTIFANSAFIGYPLIQSLWGAEGFQIAVGFELFFSPFMFSIGIMLFTGKTLGGKDFLKKIASPCMFAVILSNILYFSGIRLALPITNVLSSVGKCTTPVSMMIIGAGFVGVRFKEIFTDGLSYLVCFLKLIVYPAILYAILTFFPMLSPQARMVCVTMSALPIGSFNVILPRKYGGDAVFANKTLMVSMILSLITLPVVISLLK